MTAGLALKIPAKTLPPYKAYDLTLTGTKGDERQTSTILVVILDVDIPSLDVLID